VTDCSLTKHTCFVVAPKLPDAASLEEVKREFRIWIEAAGFRELVYTYAVFLDAIDDVCGYIEAVSDGLDHANRIRAHEAFAKRSLAEKLEMLASRYGLAPLRPGQLESLHYARNCFAHRQGILAPVDLRGSQSLSVSWHGLDIAFIESTSGTKHILTPDQMPFQSASAGDMQGHPVDRRKEFAVGDVLNFTTSELAEIC
jgi:hypothetical protein